MKNKIILLLVIFSLSQFAWTEDKIGLTLSGGGARGFAHIGVLKVIDEVGLKIDNISGTSMGAVIGGLYAIGYSADEIENIVVNSDWEKILTDEISRRDLYITEKRWKPLSKFPIQLDENLTIKLPKGLSQGHNIINKLFEFYYPVSTYRDFSTLPIGFECVASNLCTGEMKVFNEGYIYEAIRSSMSVPSLLEPFDDGDCLFVDGGINMNLPSELLVDKCDIIIGSKVNTKLFEKENLGNFFDILNQTINVGMTRNIEKSVELCDEVVTPNLAEFTSADFLKASEIIDLGEKAARKKIDYFRELAKKQNSNFSTEYNFLPQEIKFDKIKIKGNKTISKNKIIEMSDFEIDRSYSKGQINRICQNLYYYRLFEYVYPRIIENDDFGYDLMLVLKEKSTIKSNLMIRYNLNDGFILGETIELNNKVFRESKLMIHLKLGGMEEINFDYVKNFGSFYGIYFHSFPFYTRNDFDVYNEEHEKIKNSEISKLGFTNGIGLFFNRFLAFELYSFIYNSKVYDIIPDLDIREEFNSYGVGLKFYHESLDDFLFGMKGGKVLGKLSYSSEEFKAEKDYLKIHLKIQKFFPILDKQSAFFKIHYGDYLKGKNMSEPFYLGGIDNYLGIYNNELSAYNYKLISIGIRNKFKNRFFWDINFNSLDVSDENVWDLPDDKKNYSLSMQIGFNSIFLPIRLASAIDMESEVRTYLSIGYDFDNFEFSRP